MQMLYQADIGKQTPDQVRANFWKAADEVEPEVRGFAEDLFRVAVAHQEKIDELLVANSKHWRIERMPAVDRNHACPAEPAAVPHRHCCAARH